MTFKTSMEGMGENNLKKKIFATTLLGEREVVGQKMNVVIKNVGSSTHVVHCVRSSWDH